MHPNFRYFALLACSLSAFGQQLVVTAEGHNGAAPPEISKNDISVDANRKPVPVKEWVPLRGNRASLELYIVIDDGTNTDLGTQFGSLKTFISGQPTTTRLGLAYLRNGAATLIAPLTANHGQVTTALRLPVGQPGIAASPYMGISDLVKKWPATNGRREILLISSGMDPWYTPDPQNPYLQKAITDCQRAGILVHSIYYSAAGHFGHSFRTINWGQNYLSEITEETGGESYWQGFGSPVSLDSYLKDLAQRLLNQYLLTLAMDPAHGELDRVRVTSNKPGVSLVAAPKVFLQK